VLPASDVGIDDDAQQWLGPGGQCFAQCLRSFFLQDLGWVAAGELGGVEAGGVWPEDGVGADGGLAACGIVVERD
jgi:hypothetical protein